MEIRQEISGNDLYDLLWSGGLENFKGLVKDYNLDEDDILDALDNLLGGTPTITEVNDMLWFEEDAIKEYLGLADYEALEDYLDDFDKLSKKIGKDLDKAIDEAEGNELEDLEMLRDAFDAVPSVIAETVKNHDKSDDVDLILDMLIEKGDLVSDKLRDWAYDVQDWYGKYF